MTLLPLDLSPVVILSAIVVAIVSLFFTVKVDRLFGTGLSRWLLILALSITLYAVSFRLSAVSDVALAVSDVCIITAGFSAFAASRWLKRTFEVGALHDR